MAKDISDSVRAKLRSLDIDGLATTEEKRSRIEAAFRAGILSRQESNVALRMVVEGKGAPDGTNNSPPAALLDGLRRAGILVPGPSSSGAVPDEPRGSLTGGFNPHLSQHTSTGNFRNLKNERDSFLAQDNWSDVLGGKTPDTSLPQSSPSPNIYGSNPYLESTFDPSSAPKTSYTPATYDPVNYVATGYTPGSYTPATVSMPELPDVPKFEFQRNDFSEDANRMTQDAYGPAFAALDKAVSNAQNQYTVADRITKGMYENLVNDIAQGGKQDQQRYDRAIDSAGQRGQQARQDVAAAYDRSAAQEAALMRRFGLHGGETIQGDTAQKAYQQGELVQSQQAQQQGLQRSQAAQGDYNRAIQNAENTAGTVARENNLRDLGGVLANIDSQRASIGTEQALKALELGQQLSNQDLNVQQLQYGAAQDQIANLMNQAQMRLGVEQANVSAMNQAGQFNAGNQNQALAFAAGAQNQANQFNVSNQNQALAYGADQANRASELAVQNALSVWQAEQQAKADAQARQASQWNADRQYNSDQEWRKIDYETQLAQIEAQQNANAGGTSGIDFDQQGTVAQTLQRVLPMVGGNAQVATQLLQLTREVMNNPTNRMILSAAGENGRAAYIDLVANAAQKANIPIGAAIQMAADMWTLYSGSGSSK